jgi:hypothetical protein
MADKAALGQNPPPGTYSSPVSIILIFVYVLLLPERQETKPGNLPNNNALPEIREHGIEEYSGF